jgi:Protein of unknown function (DUF664)
VCVHDWRSALAITVPIEQSGRVYAETERAGLYEFLDLQREALIEKLQGVADEDARRAPTASSLSLLSLVKHSAIWERRWFQVVVAGRSFAEEWPEVQTRDENGFRLTDADTVETVVAYYWEQIAASQEIVRTWPEMAGNLRWVKVRPFRRAFMEVRSRGGRWPRSQR